MTLQPAADRAATGWLVESPIPWGQLVGFGPAGFDGYVRLRFIPDPVRSGQSETDVDMPDDHPSDHEQLSRAIKILRPFSRTPDEWYFCVWDGWGSDLPRAIRDAPQIAVLHRTFFALRGTADDFDAWESSFEDGDAPFLAFVWPADRAWCVASDVDPHWAGIGGSLPAIEALKRSALDVVAADPTDAQPVYY